MATRTTSQAGPWSQSSTWGGSAAPGNGDLAVVGHAVTVDTNTTVGVSPPGSEAVYPSVSATGGGAAGGSLPAGVYMCFYTYVDSGGGEGSPSGESNTFTVSAGNIPRVTFPALPSGVTSRKLYLTNTNGASQSERVYTTGITGTTTDLSSASWTDTTTTFAAAALPPNPAIKCTATLTIASGVTLKVRGDLVLANAGLVLSDDAILEFDASAAVSPSNTMYAVVGGTANSQFSNVVSTSGTSAAHPATVQSNAGGSNGRIRAGQTGGNAGGWNNCIAFSVNYIKFTNLGAAAIDGVQVHHNSAATTKTILFNYAIFDACGTLNFTGAIPSASTLTMTNVTFKNSLGTDCYHLKSSSTNTGGRAITDVIADVRCQIVGENFNYSRCQFRKGYTLDSSSNSWTTMDGCLLVFPSSATSVVPAGPLTNSYTLVNKPFVLTDSGTATSATSTTFTDSGKSWTVNQFNSSSTGKAWTVSIAAGTGAGQLRIISSNTATVLTLSKAWAVTPDTTSQYQIYEEVFNINCCNPLNRVAALTVTDNCFEVAGPDRQGDWYYGSSISVAVSFLRNILLPNGSEENSSNFTNFGGSAGLAITAQHNTVFTGNQTLDVGEFTRVSGMLTSIKSNIFWQYNDTGDRSPTGSLKATDLANPVSGGSAVAAAANLNYNCGWNLATGNYAGNGYNVALSDAGPAGANDINLTAGTGPTFVDSTRDFSSWAASLGSTGTYEAKIVDGLAALATLNDFSGARSTYTISALMTWVRAGFAPQNATLQNAGHDSVTVGAVEFVSSGSGARVLSGRALGDGRIFGGSVLA